MDATQSEALVVEFLESWRSRDIDLIMGYLAEDAVYHNVPVAPLQGTEAIRGIFTALLDVFGDVVLEIVNIAARPGLVITERIDRFRMANGRTVTVPVCGVFELRGGRITRFSDYFDLAGFEAASGLRL